MTARAVALNNLRALSADELADHLRQQRGQLFQVRLQQTIGQVENHRQIRAIRKEIARTMTVQVEYRLAAERGEEPPVPKAPATVSRRARRAEAEAAEAAPAEPRRRRRAEAADAVDSEPVAAVSEPVAGAEPDEALDAVSDVEVERLDDAAGGDTETTETTETTATTGADADADEDQE